jgi:hypothetical protein
VMVPSLASLAIRQFFCLMHGRWYLKHFTEPVPKR